MEVNKDNHAEEIARKLHGFCGVPPLEQERMIQNIAKKYSELESLLSEAREVIESFIECTSWGEQRASCFEKGHQVREFLSKLDGK